MKKLYYFTLMFLLTGQLLAQDLYFPPLEGEEWETIDPGELDWCEEKINNLYSFLEDRNSKAFLLLKDGKIVLEQYFNDFEPNENWYWASVGKSMMAVLTGIAQQNGDLNIEDLTSDYLGEGWTSAPADKEALITIRHQLSMTTGLDDALNNLCTEPDCLQYLADAGTRWAYHNATYYLLADVLAAASGKDFNQYFHDEITTKTGIAGEWQNSGYARILWTTPRDMARFGLLCLNNGQWDQTAVLNDADYFQDMINTAQEYNKSYGYFWWLNGKDSYMFPMTQTVFPGSLTPDAPADTYAGIGNNGQYVNVVPSEGLVLVRMGDNPGGPPAPNLFNNEMWQLINDLECSATSTKENIAQSIQVYPNPTEETVVVDLPEELTSYSIEIYDLLGQLKLRVDNESSIDVSMLPKGSYYLNIKSESGTVNRSFVKGSQ